MCDFGEARFVHSDMTNCCGTPLWMAPEVINGRYQVAIFSVIFILILDNSVKTRTRNIFRSPYRYCVLWAGVYCYVTKNKKVI